MIGIICHKNDTSYWYSLGMVQQQHRGICSGQIIATKQPVDHPNVTPKWWFQEGNSTKMHLNSGLGGTVTCPDLDLFTCSNDMYCLVLPFRKQQVLLETPGKLFTWMTQSSQCISFGLFVKPYWSILILDHACHPPYTIDIRLHVISQPPITDAKFNACQGSRTMF